MTIAAVIVHHKSLPTVGRTWRSLLREGLDSSNVLVVDNSEDEQTVANIRTLVSSEILEVPNRGFGAAANAGIDWVRAHLPSCELLLICTHEVLLKERALTRLVDTVTTAAHAGMAAPVFRLASSGEIWSYGGFVSRLGRPKHLTESATISQARTDSSSPYEVAWADGACGLYKMSALSQVRFDESYVMYYEEVDLHLRLAKLGFKLYVNPCAEASQETGGTPLFWAARNVIIYATRWVPMRKRWILLLMEFARLILAALSSPMRFRRLLCAVARGARDGRNVLRTVRTR